MMRISRSQLSVFFFAVFAAGTSLSPQETVQSESKRIEAFLRFEDGLYTGRHAVQSGRSRKEQSFRLYVSGRRMIFYFGRLPHVQDAVISYQKQWHLFDVKRRQKLLLKGALRKKPADEIGFMPSLFRLNLEELYDPFDRKESGSSVLLEFRGKTDDAFRRIAVRVSGPRKLPAETDIYDDSGILRWTLRYHTIGQIEGPDGIRISRPDFPDRLELFDLETSVSYRLDFFHFDKREFDDRVFDLDRILYAPQ